MNILPYIGVLLPNTEKAHGFRVPFVVKVILFEEAFQLTLQQGDGSPNKGSVFFGQSIVGIGDRHFVVKPIPRFAPCKFVGKG